jgi:HSP20 family molecular chaperone IbpA
MSNVIRDTEKLGQRQIETVKRRNDREVKTINANHENHKADLRNTQALEIINIQNENQMQVAQQADRKEKVLEDMRQHLQQTRLMTEKELKALAVENEKSRHALREKLLNDRQKINDDNEFFLEELNDRFNESSRKIAVDGRNRSEQMKHSMNEDFNNTKNFHQNKIQKTTEEFTNRFKAEAQRQEDVKEQQKKNFKKELFSTNLKQQNDLKKMTETHNNHIEQKDTNYRKGLKEQEDFFEKKFQTKLTSHNEQFKVLDDKNKKLVEDLKTSLTKELTKTADRNNDPFFKFETLKPKLKTMESHVEISVEIPEHSKQDVQLTINGKDAVLSFNRRFADAAKDVDGTINKINKIESFTTRLQTGHHLDPKSVKASYADGVMTYTIQKS